MSKFNEVLNKKAVALSYDEKKNAAPVIVASGMGYLAEKMVELAQECGVPVYAAFRSMRTTLLPPCWCSWGWEPRYLMSFIRR